MKSGMEPSPPSPPGHARAVAVVVRTEMEITGGWIYQITVGDSAHEVRLSWRDHDYWSGGAAAPSKVVQALIESLLASPEWIARGERLPAFFDAAKVRRWAPLVDAEVRGLL